MQPGHLSGGGFSSTVQPGMQLVGGHLLSHVQVWQPFRLTRIRQLYPLQSGAGHFDSVVVSTTGDSVVSSKGDIVSSLILSSHIHFGHSSFVTFCSKVQPSSHFSGSHCGVHTHFVQLSSSIIIVQLLPSHKGVGQIFFSTDAEQLHFGHSPLGMSVSNSHPCLQIGISHSGSQMHFVQLSSSILMLQLTPSQTGVWQVVTSAMLLLSTISLHMHIGHLPSGTSVCS